MSLQNQLSQALVRAAVTLANRPIPVGHLTSVVSSLQLQHHTLEFTRLLDLLSICLRCVVPREPETQQERGLEASYMRSESLREDRQIQGESRL